MITAGSLRHRITLLRPTIQRTADGEKKEVWEVVGDVWAEVLSPRGQTYLRSREAHAEQTHKITIRYRDDIGPTWKVRHDGTEYSINHVADLKGRRAWLELMCTEVIT